MELSNFEKDKSYLVESKHGISKMTVLDISETCIKIEWESGRKDWLRKDEFTFKVEFPLDRMRVIERLN